MGGGDLNLKKSWHPSTMKNMEKVWKAEQRHEQEKKKIAELQREIREEREREEIRKFAEDGGVIEKKDECKLDWMYKGPGGIVSREDYLLGRAIDKSFDLLQESEKEAAHSSSAEGNSRVLPGRSGLLDDQVDIARKLQEDPLLLIKKKEMETRSQILNNPVKLKQLQRMLKEEKSRVSKKSKKKKKRKRKHRSSSSSEDGDLDQILASKYSRLKDKLNTVEMAQLLSDEEEDRERKRNKGKGDGRRDESSAREKNDETPRFPKGYGLIDPLGNQRKPQADTSSGSKKDKSGKRDQDSMRASNEKEKSSKNAPSRRYGESHRPPPSKKPLNEEELDQRRREMMDNARWREEQREKNVLNQREEEKREKKAMNSQTYDPSFLRKQLSVAASKGSVEGRIKSNINNIQRSGGAMDKNFAKR